VSNSFAKLDGGIVDSTLWMQPHDVLRVWIAMLAKAGRTGFVRASVPSMAHLCMVPIERLEQILAILTSPDPYSRTAADEGRRLRAEEGGWQIVNYLAYRNARDEDLRREQQREWDRANRPSGHARQSDAVRQQSDSPTESDTVRDGPANAEAEADRASGDKSPSANLRSARKRGTQADQPESPAVVTLPLNDGSEFPITEAQVREFADLYPAVDVVQALRSMRGWCVSNPRNRKTRAGVLRFVNRWLDNEQNKAGRAGGGNHAPHRESAAERSARLAREGDERDRRDGLER
jgi:hypothetical protein